MSDTVEMFRALHQDRQERGEVNRARAVADYPEARELARRNGLSLVRYGHAHYALVRYVNRKAMWRHHIHPGNRRIRADVNMPTRAPYLKVPCEWGLTDVVQAAIKEMSE